MRPSPLGVLCFVVVCITLSLGLWPFHAPRNDVRWLEHINGLNFGRHGTVLSRAPFPRARSSGSIEIWVQPKRWSGSAALLTLYRPGTGLVFTLRQSLTDLEVSAEYQGAGIRKRPRKSSFYVDDALAPALQQSKPVLITVTSGSGGTKVYLEGALAQAVSRFRIPQDAFNGWLIVGDSVGQSDSFFGEIRGLAIYDLDLDSAEVFQHFRDWRESGSSHLPDASHQTALYLFDERRGDAIHNRAAPGGDLYIPRKYAVTNQMFLQPIWEEFNFSRGYWTGDLKNVIGFVPAGFCFYAYFVWVRPTRRALLLAVIAGALVSLTIEVLQAFLPTRDSGTTDLITNTLGTCLGAFCYKRASRVLIQTWPQFAWFAKHPSQAQAQNRV